MISLKLLLSSLVKLCRNESSECFLDRLVDPELVLLLLLLRTDAGALCSACSRGVSKVAGLLDTVRREEELVIVCVVNWASGLTTSIRWPPSARELGVELA